MNNANEWDCESYNDLEAYCATKLREKWANEDPSERDWKRKQREKKLFKFVDLIMRNISIKSVKKCLTFLGLKIRIPPTTYGVVRKVERAYDDADIGAKIWKLKIWGCSMKFRGFQILNTLYCPLKKMLDYNFTKILQPLVFLNHVRKKHQGRELSFPSEIWLKLVKFGVSPGNLIRVNKRLFNVFSPTVYSSFHLDLVLSSTDILKAHYRYHLNFGFESPFHEPNLYELYDDFQKAKEAKYEFLSTSHRHFPDQNTVITDIKLDSGAVIPFETRIIRDFKAVQKFLELTVANKKSKFRPFIQELSANITVLDGYKDLIESSNQFGNTLKDLSKLNSPVNVISCDPGPYHVFEFESTGYENNVRGNVRPDPDDIYPLDFQLYMYPIAQEVFPKYPYYKDLIIAGVVFDDLQSKKQRRRLHDIGTQQELEESNPFETWNRICLPGDSYYLQDSIVDKGPGRIKIHSREFSTESQTHEFLSRFITAVSTFELHRKLKCSILISGVTESYNSFDTNAPRPNEEAEAVEPQVILINRNNNFQAAANELLL